MVAREELLKGDEIAKALAHLLPVDGDHVVVHPVVHHLVALRRHGLCYLALVVGEDEVHAATVDVEVVAQILPSHCRALAVPAGEAVAPRTWPAHDVLWRGALPQREVGLAFLLVGAGELTALVDDVGEVAARQYAVFVVLVVFLYVEIHGAIALVGISVFEDLLHELLLLDDMARGMGLYGWRQGVEELHGLVVAVGVILRYLHRLQLLQACLLLDLVVALVGVVLKVAHVGDVAHVAHLIAQMAKVTEEHVEGDGRASVSQMWVAVYRGTTNIHAHVWGVKGLEELLLSR